MFEAHEMRVLIDYFHFRHPLDRVQSLLDACLCLCSTFLYLLYMPMMKIKMLLLLCVCVVCVKPATHYATLLLQQFFPLFQLVDRHSNTQQLQSEKMLQQQSCIVSGGLNGTRISLISPKLLFERACKTVLGLKVLLALKTTFILLLL